MYTLTRKLSVVCLTVVLSFLVYGCGGSSKQALITDVSTDLVTAGLMPDPGTYTIGPGGTANAGDVTFSCPAGGPTCKITVASDGTIMSVEGSAEGMATAMDSDFAIAKAERDAARMELTTTQGERDDARTALMNAQTALTTTQGERNDARTALMNAETDLTTTQGERNDARTALMNAQTALTTALGERDDARTALMNAQTALTTTQGERNDARTALMNAQTDLTTAQGERNDARTALMNAQTALTTALGERDDARTALMNAQTALTTALGERDDALLAQQAAEAEARLLTTVTSIVPKLAPKFVRVAKTAIYEVDPGTPKIVPNSDVVIDCPGAKRCTVVVAVNEKGEATYTSLGGVATVTNTDVALHTRMAIALFSPTDFEGNVRTAGGLTAQAAPATVAPFDGPPLDNMTGVERSVDGRTTKFTLTHNMEEESDHVDNKYTGDEPVDIGHGITNWIGRTLKRDNGTEDRTATKEDEGTFYTNIMKATPGKWKVSGNDATISEYVFTIDPDQVLSEEDGATFTGAYITEDGVIPGTYTCVNTGGVCGDPGTPITSGETGNLLLETELGLNWKFESKYDVKKGNVADKDYMYFGYWLQMPVEQNDDAASYKFRAYSGGTGANVFEVDALLRDAIDPLTAVYKGGAAGMYVTRNLQFKDEVADPLSPGFYGRFTATAELTAYFGAHTNLDTPITNMLDGSIKEFKDPGSGRNLDFDVTLSPVEITAGGDQIAGDTRFGGTAAGTDSGNWSANFYGPNATNPIAMNTTLPSGVAGKFDASTIYTKVIGAFAAEKQ